MFAFSIFMTSCAKEENIEVVEETVEEIQPIMALTINGVTNTYDAYAAYCEENGVVSATVSNNQALLDGPINTEDLAIGDFIVLYRNDGTNPVVTLGGAGFENSNGEQWFVLDTEATVNITEANSTVVSGDMEGTFFLGVPGPNAETADYSVEFTAEVIPGITPVLCQ